MNKKKATQETIDAFLSAVYPEMTELATTFGSEDSVLKDATEKIAALKKAEEQIAKLENQVSVRDMRITDYKEQIATLKANAEFLSSELERLRSRVVLTPAESCLTLQAALEEGESHENK
uniref:Uncharacterized protein n=3 Tax=viral metagenome TaxID=1070528 RepID=A0A6M3L470_9ZZZZ